MDSFFTDIEAKYAELDEAEQKRKSKSKSKSKKKQQDNVTMVTVFCMICYVLLFVTWFFNFIDENYSISSLIKSLLSCQITDTMRQ